MQSIDDLFHDVLKDPLKYAEYIGLFLGALVGVIKALHALLLAVELVAKLTPTKSDDDAVRALDGWVLKAEAGLIWLQQKLLMLRAPKAAARMSREPAGMAPMPSDRPTKPDRPGSKRAP